MSDYTRKEKVDGGQYKACKAELVSKQPHSRPEYCYGKTFLDVCEEIHSIPVHSNTVTKSSVWMVVIRYCGGVRLVTV